MNWRIVRPWCGALALWLATATSLALAQQTTPAAISTLDVFADSQTVVVARLNPAKVDAKNLIEFATPAFAKANLPADQQTQFENGLTQFQTTWRAGGGRRTLSVRQLGRRAPLAPVSGRRDGRRSER